MRHTPPGEVTGRTRAVYAAIATHIETEGYVPSIRDLCRIMDLRSTSTVAYHLTALERAGLIARPPGANRAIKLVRPPTVSHRCPLCGHRAVAVDLVAMAKARNKEVTR